MKLTELLLNETGIVESVDLSLISAQRLIEMGFSKGTAISVELMGISPTLKAYRIKNTILAIRNETAEHINIKLL